ncbi:class F sortase [Streptomyces sp. DT2A-34]|uniref:class F sortase n=1 Tax=Streptomyces sp. DT2A-34 TaxID=3051182 RepID=UPI00265C6863|nr:class F sortase [Streptomyces sp. DT2A-34]MDO0917188.1 class F sortase [Streptomyces sp. DT2A-34]
MAAGRSSSPDADPALRDAGSVASRRIRRAAAATFWSVVAVMTLMVTLPDGRYEAPEPRSAPHAPPAVEPRTPPAAEPSSPAPQHAGKHLPRSRPTRLRIPKISVDAPFTDLAIGSSGQLQPPPAHDTNLVGWYAKGASPGEPGTSIIAGHVDTATSAAVFANLSELKKGDRFQVDRADGRRASFVIDSVEMFDKDDFPSRRVYGDTPRPQVRLITCAGDYDRQVRDYTANLVVFAHLA